MKAKVTLTITCEDSAWDNGTLDKDFVKENFSDLVEDPDAVIEVDEVEILEAQKDTGEE